LYFLNIKIFLRFFDTITVFYLLKAGRCEPHRQVRATRAGASRTDSCSTTSSRSTTSILGVKWINDEIRREIYKVYRKLTG